MTRREHEEASVMDEVGALLTSAILAIDRYDTPAPSLVDCTVELHPADASARRLQLRDGRLFVVRVSLVEP